MPYRNEALIYPVLRGGILISCPVNGNEVGTLGCLLTDGNQKWLLSCYHVLGRKDLSPAGNNEAVLQGSNGVTTIAMLDVARCDAARDYAVALIQPGRKTDPAILHIGKLTGVAAPQVGMKVIKCGADTGVTEGVISSVSAGKVAIEHDSSFPPSYRISAGGDSGSVWIDQATRAAVALHQQGTGTKAYGIPLPDVLNALHLHLVT